MPEAILHPNGLFRFIGTNDWDEDGGRGEILAKLTDSPHIVGNALLFAAAADYYAAAEAIREYLVYAEQADGAEDRVPVQLLRALLDAHRKADPSRYLPPHESSRTPAKVREIENRILADGEAVRP